MTKENLKKSFELLFPMASPDDFVSMQANKCVEICELYADQQTAEKDKRIRELEDKVKKLEFMIDKGLGWDDMKNDITMPHEL